jgi:hypothetical protein
MISSPATYLAPPLADEPPVAEIEPLTMLDNPT